MFPQDLFVPLTSNAVSPPGKDIGTESSCVRSLFAMVKFRFLLFRTEINGAFVCHPD